MAYDFNEAGSLFTEGATGKEAEAKKKAAEEMMAQRKTEEGEERAAASTGIGSILGGIIGALVAGIPTAGAGAAAGFAAGSAIGGAAGGLAGEAMKDKPSVGKALQKTGELGKSAISGANTFGGGGSTSTTVAGIKNAGETDIMGRAGNKVGTGVKSFMA